MFTNLKFDKNTALFSLTNKQYVSLMHVYYRKIGTGEDK